MVRINKIKMLPIKTGTDFSMTIKLPDMDITGWTFKCQLYDDTVTPSQLKAEMLATPEVVTRTIAFTITRDVTRTFDAGKTYKGDILFISPTDQAVAYLDVEAPIARGYTQHA